MSPLPAPDSPVVFLAHEGNQVGPMPLDDVVAGIAAGTYPRSIPVWWEGLAAWTPADTHPELAPRLAPPTPPMPGPAAAPPPPPGGPAAPPAPGPAPGAPAAAPVEADAEELEALFSEMVHASWRHYKRVDFATRLDEVLIGALITSTLDAGNVLIDLTSNGNNHYLRFQSPEDGSRITMALTHLTPSAVDGEVLGHHASVVIGWGRRVADASNVVNALKQELKSSAIQTPEPGTVTVDGDLTSGYAYTQIDLIWSLDDFVTSDYEVDTERLTRYVRAAVHSLRKYWYGRFTPGS